MTHLFSFYTKASFPPLSRSFHSLLRHSKDVTQSVTKSSKIEDNLICKRCLTSSNGNIALPRGNNEKNYNELYVNNNYPKDVSSRHQRLLPRAALSLLTATEHKRSYSQQTRGLKGMRDKVGQTVNDIINPIDRLQRFVVKPILPEEEYVFKPSINDINKAQKLFRPTQNNQIQFLKSALMEEHLPEYELPEVAFIGKSNVGKSSLIKMLLSQTEVDVRVSSKPGHTRLLNFFQIGKHFTLVDMPGYGFNMPKHYSASVERFLLSRKKLSRTFLLIDGTVGITEGDVIGLNMLEEFQIPFVMTFLLMDGKLGPTNTDALRFDILKSLNIDFCIVVTKIDKAKPATLLKSFMSVLQYRNQTSHCFPQPFLVSSVNGEGIPVLQSFIAYVTGNLSVQNV